MAAPLIYTPSPTVRQAIVSDKTYIVMMAERGSGKTLGQLMGLVWYAMALRPDERPLRCPVVRDTRRALGKSTAVTIKQWFPPNQTSKWWGKEDEPERCVIADPKLGKLIDFWFVGCDNPGDLDQFQSYECGAAWFEEPAPAGDLSSGVDATVFAMAVSSSRQHGKFRLAISMNPPDPGHWTVKCWPQLLDNPEEAEGDLSLVPEEVRAEFWANSAVFKIPRSENQSERTKPGYLRRMEVALLMAGRPDLVERLVRGRVGAIQIGEPVTPEFDEAMHASVELAPVRPGDRLVLSWDGGHQPACIVWRPRSGTALEVLAAFQAEHAGMRQFVQNQVLPWVAAHVPQGVRWQHTGDPNLRTGDQSNTEESALRILLELLPTGLGEAEGGWVMGPVSKAEREGPVHEVLHPGWRPPVRIDRRYGRPLIKALGGEWRRKRDPSGTVIAGDWVKNLAANTAEAFAYGCALFVKRRGSEGLMERWKRRVQGNREAERGSVTHV